MLTHPFKQIGFMCLSPITLKRLDKATHKVVERVVPCGVCPECLKKRQSAIVVRSLVELSKHSQLWMFTLTYKPEKLPCTENGEVSLRREDIKNWKKNFRKLISTSDFSWICCGEYSPRGDHRPHYHGLVFGLSREDINIMDRCWSDKYGFTVFKQVTSASQKDACNVARYVSKYVVKDVEFKSPSLDVEQPRLMSSIGFGYPDERFFNWLLCKDKYDYNLFDSSTISMSIVLDVIDRMYFNYQGFHYSIPSYVLRKKFYKKTASQTYSPSPLLRMVNYVKKFRSESLRLDSLRQFDLSHPERTFYQNVVEFENSKRLLSDEKRIVERKNLISTYKKSVI